MAAQSEEESDTCPAESTDEDEDEDASRGETSESGDDDNSSGSSGEGPVAWGLIELSHEWCGFDTADGSAASAVSPCMGRTTRYKNMARAIEAAERRYGEGQSRRETNRLRFQALTGFLIFLCANAKCVVAVDFVLHYAGYELIRPCDWSGFLLDSWYVVFTILDVLFIAFQIACVRRDRCLVKLRKSLWRAGKYFQLAALNVFAFVVLGIFSGWQVMRTIRQLIRPSYRDSFLAELNDPGMVSDNAARMPLYSSHLAFMYELPFVFREVHLLSRNMLNPCDIPIFVAWCLGLHLIVAALVTFDYSVSNYIRERHSSASACRFGFMHWLYRACEVLARSLVCGTLMLENFRHHPCRVLTLMAVDFLIGFAVLCKVSGGVSGRSVFVSLILTCGNLALFADAAGLGADANRVTVVLDWKQSVEVAAAAAAYYQVWRRTRGHKSGSNLFYEQRLLACLLVMVSAAFICCVLRATGLVRKAAAKEESSADAEYSDSEAVARPNVFGKPVEESVYFLSGSPSTLAALLFSRGIGDQFASLLEIFWEKDELRLSRLELVGRLGEGGFGKVVQVQDTRSGAMYALKLQRMDRSSAVAVREAEFLHGIDHPFIVDLVRVFRTTVFYSIVLELCGQDLNKLILATEAASGQIEGLPRHDVQHFTACLALALEHLHSRSIIFRDLKPENVLTSLAGSSARNARIDAKLADFGLARHVSAEQFKAVSLGAGTPAFMPLECCQGWPATGLEPERAVQQLQSRDWYALGCCVMLLLLGERGSRVARAADRAVLLPPGAGEIQDTLRSFEGTLGDKGDALALAMSLTAEAPEDRAGAPDVRRSPFLREALREAQELAPRRQR